MTETDDTTDSRTDTEVITTPPENSPDEQSRPDSPGDEPGDSRRVTLRRGLNALGIVLLLAVVAPFVVYAVPGVVGADASFVVLSGSMEPAISAGDVVVVESVPPATVAVDDVITYSRSEEAATVTHRVIDIEGTGDGRVFYTKGDANEDPDQRPVPASALVGTVVLTIPYIGYVIQFVGTTTGFALLVVLPFAALLISEVAMFLRRRRKGETGAERTTSERRPPTDVAAAAPHAPQRNGDGPVREAPAHTEGPAHTESRPAEQSTESADAVEISSTDMVLTLGVLGAVLPYAVYVAVEQQSALSIGVAVGFGTAFVLLAGVFLTTRLRERSQGHPARSPPAEPTAASDGGVPEEEP